LRFKLSTAIISLLSSPEKSLDKEKLSVLFLASKAFVRLEVSTAFEIIPHFIYLFATIVNLILSETEWRSNSF